MYLRKADLYFYGLALMAIGLPVSEFLMSLSMFLLAIAWLLNGPKKIQLSAFKKNKLAWSGVILFLIPFVSLLWTSDYEFALHDLRIKLPLLLIPIFISASFISKKQFYILLGLMVGSAFVGSVILFVNYQINLKGELVNIRDISIFISHIRFSLIINISIYILLYAIYKWRNKYAFVALGMCIWFVYIIFFLGSGNGFIGLIALFIFSIFVFYREVENRRITYVIGAASLLFASYLIYLSVLSYSSYFIVKDDAYNKQEIFSEKNAGYFSLLEDEQLENGYYIWRNVSNKQMLIAWEKIGGTEFQKSDMKDQPILGTLTRYLTSLALPKDSSGVYQLSSKDIENIQMGYFHYDQYKWNNLHLRVEQFFYQLMAFRYQSDHGNKPFLQRFYYWGAAFEIIESNPVFGVGAGDIKTEFNRFFESNKTKIGEGYRYTTHNQYLTYFVSAGIIGFILFIIAVFYPLSVYIKRNYILSFAQLILLISFIAEDTLETQPGVTMYVFFIALGIALFNDPGSKTEDIKTEYPLSSVED